MSKVDSFLKFVFDLFSQPFEWATNEKEFQNRSFEVAKEWRIQVWAKIKKSERCFMQRSYEILLKKLNYLGPFINCRYEWLHLGSCAR